MTNFLKGVLATALLLLSACNFQPTSGQQPPPGDTGKGPGVDTQAGPVAYDILWVVANSANVVLAKKGAFIDAIPGFFQALDPHHDASLRMAMVTTNFFSEHGDLVKTPEGLSILDSATGSDLQGDFEELFQAAFNTVAATSFWHEGLESAYQALSQHAADLQRPGVPLVVIFFDDRDDYSCQSNCGGVEPWNNTTFVPFPLSRYVDFFGARKATIFNLVRLADDTCPLNTSTRFISLQQQLGHGATVSGCEATLGNSMRSVAEALARGL